MTSLTKSIFLILSFCLGLMADVDTSVSCQIGSVLSSGVSNCGGFGAQANSSMTTGFSDNAFSVVSNQFTQAYPNGVIEVTEADSSGWQGVNITSGGSGEGWVDITGMVSAVRSGYGNAQIVYTLSDDSGVIDTVSCLDGFCISPMGFFPIQLGTGITFVETATATSQGGEGPSAAVAVSNLQMTFYLADRTTPVDVVDPPFGQTVVPEPFGLGIIGLGLIGIRMKGGSKIQ